jgi:hypothetical protein
MTWFSPLLVPNEDRFGGLAPDVWSAWPSAEGLGSAIAGAWSWDTAPSKNARDGARQQPARRPEAVRLSAPSETLRRMARAARALGRAESDVWVEAAREWLQRHAPEGDGGGPEPLASRTPSDSTLLRRCREWRAIDAVLDTLREDIPPPQSKPSAA